jgi:hypothetical protein
MNDGSYFAPQAPLEDQLAERQERAIVLEDSTLIEQTIEWFAEQINAANEISSLDTEAKLSLEVQVAARQQLVGLLTAKKGELEALLKAYKK